MMKERMTALLTMMNRGIYEKDTEVALSLLAALSGESIIFLGPPGVAKSMVARRLKRAFHDAKGFEYLMSRFSTPDEIFGPVSITKLKSSDSYERMTDGFLPSADVVFLDEIWKAGPAIQNTLLTALNEKVFRNGDREMHLPLKLLVAASNELPAQGEGLEALWDRFLIRVECKNITSEQDFRKMLLDTGEEKTDITTDLQITNEEYAAWSREIDRIGVPDSILSIITMIRRSLRNVALADTGEFHNVYVSDRRWKKIVRLMRTSAFVNDRSEVAVADTPPISHCLWQEPDEAPGIRDIVFRSLLSQSFTKMEDIKKGMAEDIRMCIQHRAVSEARKEMGGEDARKKVFDGIYYHVLDHDTGNTYVLISDYHKMKRWSRGNAGDAGVIYRDKIDSKRSLVRIMAPTDTTSTRLRQVSLTRDDRHIFIDGVMFEIEELARGERQQLPQKVGRVTGRDYYREIEVLADEVSRQDRDIRQNIFLSAEDKTVLGEMIQGLYKDIAFARQDLEKL